MTPEDEALARRVVAGAPLADAGESLVCALLAALDAERAAHEETRRALVRVGDEWHEIVTRVEAERDAAIARVREVAERVAREAHAHGRCGLHERLLPAILDRHCGPESAEEREVMEAIRAEARAAALEEAAGRCEEMADDHGAWGTHASQALVTAARDLRALGAQPSPPDRGVCRTPPGCARHWEERNRELVRENDVLRSNSDHLSSENASLSSQVESMAMRIESLAEELAKPEDVRLREVLDALEGRAVIFDGLGARVGHLLDEMDEWIGRAGEAERAVEAAQRRLACVADDMTEHAYQELASALEAPPRVADRTTDFDPPGAEYTVGDALGLRGR